MPDIEALNGCSNKKGASIACCICCLISVVAIIVIASLIAGYHTITEGHVGIYFRYGALQDRVGMPGVNFMQPFVTSYQEVRIRPQTDETDVEAVTQDGIKITFDGIQIITRIKQDHLSRMIKEYGIDFKKALVFDRIKEDLSLYCANHTIHEVYNSKFLEIVEHVKINLNESISRLAKNGIDILNLVVPKPDIPQDIAHNYKQVKVQWTEQLVAIQQQKTETIKKETESIRAIADAERMKDVLEIKIMERVLDKEGERNISTINNLIVTDKEQNLADIEKYKMEKQAEANKLLYSTEYVKLEMAKALATNTKFYFSGENSIMGGLLNTFLENSIMGGLLNTFLENRG